MYIYGLCDPVTQELRYVGKTNNIMLRYNNHISSIKSKTIKNSWIKSLLNKNTRPEIFILDEVPDSEWIFWEQWYIQYFKTIGCRLTNDPRCLGGENPPSHLGEHHSKEVIEKIRKSNTGKKLSEYTKSKISQSKIGAYGFWNNKTRDIKTKNKISESKKNRPNLHRRKFTNEQICEIKRLIRNQNSLGYIATLFNSNKTTISNIKNKKIYREIP